MKLTIVLMGLIIFGSTQFALSQSLPSKIKSRLDKNYKGWKFSPSTEDCGCKANKGFVSGYFDSNKTLDYAIKFTKGKRSFMMAFLKVGNEYKPFVLHNEKDFKAADVCLGVWKKGGKFELGDQNVYVKYDAPSDFECESDVGGIHLYKNGKFIAY